MTRVLAAIDGTAASPGVLRVATEVGRVLGADVDVVYVDDEAESKQAELHVLDPNLTLRRLGGPVESAIVTEASAPDVEAVVVGLRGTVGGSRAVGHVALHVIDHADAIVVVVPPTTPATFELRTVLVPIHGRPADALEHVVRLGHSVDLALVILHVHNESSIPAFEDQPHYDVEAWADEFLARWVPGARDAVVEVRVGAPEEEIIGVARECGAQMIAVGWDRDRSPGRATIVQAVLRRGDVPVALLPIRVHGPATVGTR